MSVGDARYAPFYADMRRRCGYCGPYRLGIAIGEAGEDLPNPYTNPKSAKVFADGLLAGHERRRRDEAERDIRIAIWNACRTGGMGQDLSQALIQRAMSEPAMRRAIQAAVR
jgi:hypothetical protein